MKIYISADIEGCAGISSWEETGDDGYNYAYFAKQMSRETAAAAEAALTRADEVLVRDAHGTGRNMYPDLFPRGVKFFRNWSGDPLNMMEGIDDSFDACMMVGYHSAAGSGGNPLSHTWSSRRIFEMRINGEAISECWLNSLIASYFGCPLIFLAGDKVLCEQMAAKIPGLTTVACNEGRGQASISLHPLDAVDTIRREAEQALQKPFPQAMEIPDHILYEIEYKEHHDCYKKSFYPGIKKKGERTLALDTNDFYEVIRFLTFAL